MSFKWWWEPGRWSSRVDAAHHYALKTHAQAVEQRMQQGIENKRVVDAELDQLLKLVPSGLTAVTRQLLEDLKSAFEDKLLNLRSRGLIQDPIPAVMALTDMKSNILVHYLGAVLVTSDKPKEKP